MRRGERGANLAEFAIVVPLMVLLICGIVDVGRAFYGFIVVTNAVGEGARYGARKPDDTAGIIQKVKDEMGSSSVFFASCANATTSKPTVGSTPSIEVSVECKFDPITPFIQSFGTGGQLIISNYARARIQGVS